MRSGKCRFQGEQITIVCDGKLQSPGLVERLGQLPPQPRFIALPGRRNAATASYRKAIDLKPDYIEAYVNLGSVFVKMQRYEDAITEFQRALQIDPDFVPARTNLQRVQDFLRANRK